MKVVIVYASSGAGHQKAAEAVFKALRGRSGVDLQLIDALDYTTAPFRFLYPRIYLFLIRHLPSVWGFFYGGLNVVLIGPFLRCLRRLLNALNGKALEKFFLSERPDVIVSTHFFASEVASTLKAKRKLKTHLLTVVTDFVVHSVWMATQTDRYVVGAEDARDALMRRGVPGEKISLLGIPIDPLFERVEDRTALSKKIGADPELFTVLIVSGGFGVGPIENLVSHLSRHSRLQLLVVCGHNLSLYRRLTSQTASVRKRVHLFEFVDNMHELMSISDCMISKSGGLTMSEALAKRLPPFILYPIPGQEGGNRDVLVRHHAALPVKNIRDLEKRFSDLAQLKKTLAEVKQGIDRFSQRHTAVRIAEHVLSQGGTA